jgi:hypothetical protein
LEVVEEMRLWAVHLTHMHAAGRQDMAFRLQLPPSLTQNLLTLPLSRVYIFNEYFKWNGKPAIAHSILKGAAK